MLDTLSARGRRTRTPLYCWFQLRPLVSLSSILRLETFRTTPWAPWTALSFLAATSAGDGVFPSSVLVLVASATIKPLVKREPPGTSLRREKGGNRDLYAGVAGVSGTTR